MAASPLQCSCLGESHGQRSLAGYSPWGHKESYLTEWTAPKVWDTYLNRSVHSTSLKRQWELRLEDPVPWTPGHAIPPGPFTWLLGISGVVPRARQVSNLPFVPLFLTDIKANMIRNRLTALSRKNKQFLTGSKFWEQLNLLNIFQTAF